MEKIITKSASETKDFGRACGQACRGGEIFYLSGDLGAGKTTFLQGLAKGLGVSGPVNSPTFNILKIYKTKKGSVVKNFCHIDAYRLSGAKDLEALGIKEIIAAQDTVTAVEWAEKVKSVFPKSAVKIKAKHISDAEREFVVLDKK
ncbi:MAG: tRNA (adenosine(37)-N6)-threonylcarbamoyltransferase complex ATPase subunit type 1 TsaE [Candidatus Falkowbacteria bacterium]|nr:MAG: tRNA (adenosine(37)-N6)-threonylcarbamoyltransferase complex ATPase subunit type 1 TsaE [Candidatus Falkowbacteria bacterium]